MKESERGGEEVRRSGGERECYLWDLGVELLMTFVCRILHSHMLEDEIQSMYYLPSFLLLLLLFLFVFTNKIGRLSSFRSSLFGEL